MSAVPVDAGPLTASAAAGSSKEEQSFAGGLPSRKRVGDEAPSTNGGSSTSGSTGSNGSSGGAKHRKLSAIDNRNLLEAPSTNETLPAGGDGESLSITSAAVAAVIGAQGVNNARLSEDPIEADSDLPDKPKVARASHEIVTLPNTFHESPVSAAPQGATAVDSNSKESSAREGWNTRDDQKTPAVSASESMLQQHQQRTAAAAALLQEAANPGSQNSNPLAHLTDQELLRELLLQNQHRQVAGVPLVAAAVAATAAGVPSAVPVHVLDSNQIQELLFQMNGRGLGVPSNGSLNYSTNRTLASQAPGMGPNGTAGAFASVAYSDGSNRLNGDESQGSGLHQQPSSPFAVSARQGAPETHSGAMGSSNADGSFLRQLLQHGSSRALPQQGVHLNQQHQYPPIAGPSNDTLLNHLLRTNVGGHSARLQQQHASHLFHGGMAPTEQQHLVTMQMWQQMHQQQLLLQSGTSHFQAAASQLPYNNNPLLNSLETSRADESGVALNASTVDANTTPHPQGSPPPNSVPMEAASDVGQLSRYQILVRRQLEYFVSQKDDAEYSVQGRKKQARLGQVGIRCKHCSHMPHRLRGRGAGYYPAKLAGVYQAAQNMATNHLNQFCNAIPSEIRETLRSLRGGRHDSAAGGGKQYWADACSELGLVEDDKDEGLRFRRNCGPIQTT